MEPRKLKALLGVLKAAGVTRYTFGDLTVQFGDPPTQVRDAPANEDVGDLELPAGVIDPRKALSDIYARRKKGRAA